MRLPADYPCRPFADSDQETRIRFYPCDKDALDLGFESNLFPPQWLADYERGDYPGVVPYRRSVPNNSKAIPGSGRGHVCGTREEFGGEALYDPEAAPVLYRTNGLPVCCPSSLLERGGVGLGGADRVLAPEPRGCFCTEAKVGVVGVTYNEIAVMQTCLGPTGFRTSFRTFAGLTPGATYHVEGIAHLVGGGNSETAILDGVCGHLIGGGATGVGAGDWPYHFTFTAPAGGVIQLDMLIIGSGFGDYVTDRVDAGP